MSEKDTDNLMLKTILDIKEHLGKQDGVLMGIKATLDNPENGLLSRMQKVEKRQTVTSTKLYMFGAAISAIVTLGLKQFGL